MFGDDISAKFLEKWPTFYKQKVIEQSRGLTQRADLQDLLQNAESTEELENGTLGWTYTLMEGWIVFERTAETQLLVKMYIWIFEKC